MKKLWLLLLVFSLPTMAQITGLVVDQNTQAPIADAIVRIQKRQIVVKTDTNGFFSLNDTQAFPFTIVAGAYGFYNKGEEIFDNAGLQNIILEMEPVPLDITPHFPLTDPTQCQNCHPNQYDQWLGSPMQMTGLNTWVFDVYDGKGTPGGGGLPDGSGTPGGDNGFVYQRDSVHRFAKPNSDCSACHSPVHWLTDIKTAGMGDIDMPNMDMMNGVQCEVCHRSFDVPSDKSNWPGVFPEAFKLIRGSQLVEFGAIGDATYENGVMRPAYNPQLTDQLCSACHEDNVDHDDDDDYEDPGSIPHETTYSEWQSYKALNGDSASTCVGCHMPATDADQYCLFIEGREVGTIRSHNIRGTTPGFLENALTLNVGKDSPLGTLDVDVTLTNDGAGHAVPTGVVIRNVILLVEAFAPGNTRLTQLSGDQVDVIGGVGDPLQGNFAGLPGVSFYKNMVDQGGAEGIFYTDAVAIASDNRIMPGQSYQGQFTFQIPPGLSSSDIDVNVRVIYRRSFRYLTIQKGWTTTGHGDPLADIQAPHYGHLMEQSQSMIDVCSNKEIDGTPGITLGDVQALNDQWMEPAPFAAGQAPITNVQHFVAVVNCRSEVPN